MVGRARSGGIALAALAASVIPAAGAGARPAEVDVGGTRFAPAEIRVEVDDTVRWVVREDEHTVTSDDGLFDSGRAGPGSIYVARFHNPGRYAYFCSIHGARGGEGMSGLVVVVGDAATPAEVTTTTQAPTTTTTTGPAPATTGPPPPQQPSPAAPAPAPEPEPAPQASRPTPTAARAATTTTTPAAPPAGPDPVAPTAAPTALPLSTTAAALSPLTAGTTSSASGTKRHAAGPVPETPDPPTPRLSRTQRRARQPLATASPIARREGDERGSDTLVVTGAVFLIAAGMVLVVPGWRTRRP